MKKDIKKVVLAYSGGLDTSAMLLWIKESYGAEVICFCADVGQGEELDGLEEKALKEGADAVAHGATGKGNDQVRFELTYYALQPDIKVIAPWRHWDFKGRADLIAYCAEHGINVTATAEKPYSMDRNLMHISYEGGILEDPWAEAPENIFQLTRSPENARAEAQAIEISFA